VKGLKELSETEFILREVRTRFNKPCQLWSTGKDSTLLLWLTRRLFREVPWPVVHLDTGKHFREVYEFRDRVAREWALNLVVAKHPKAELTSPEAEGRFGCCSKLKTETLRACIEEHRFDAVLTSIRWDEHSIRGKERYVSPRDKEFRWDYLDQDLELPSVIFTDFPEAHHLRVHPLLNWNIYEVWEYSITHQIPFNPLYLKGYTSLGCKPCTSHTLSPSKTIGEFFEKLRGAEERGGRARDEEMTMLRLRALGYM